MRELKFRGIRKEYDKDWHESAFKYGNLLNPQTIGEVGSDLDSYEYADVIPETVGQFTGLKDKNGKEIYEGDVYSTFDRNGEDEEGMELFVRREYVVEYKKGVCSIGFQFLSHPSNIEVIGNIHENKNLLK